ncbi:unnamed protein product [Durusdinium trenchii]|uniref:Uncharacterized protein n=1 Tax=Durusdinium trenchii TaxID=1381693 RepID=A0ABP0NK55_9DINO
MRPFLILVLVVAAWSIRNNEQVMDSDGYKDLPQKGQPCAAKPCRERGRWSSKCCAEGLVCDRETFTCKVAIGQPCRGKTFYTECAGKYTYDRDLACVKDESKNYRCCIITGNRYTQFMTKNHQKYHQTYGRGRGANCCSGNSTEVMRFDYREGTDVPTQICTGKHSRDFGHLWLHLSGPVRRPEMMLTIIFENSASVSLNSVYYEIESIQLFDKFKRSPAQDLLYVNLLTTICIARICRHTTAPAQGTSPSPPDTTPYPEPPIPEAWKQTDVHWDANGSGGQKLYKCIQPSAWSRNRQLAGPPTFQVFPWLLAYYGASDYPLPIKRKYTSLVTTRSIAKSVCLTHLIQQIREQRIDLDATAEALHRTAGNTPPSKTTEARALMQPLMDIILTAIRDHAPAPKRSGIPETRALGQPLSSLQQASVSCDSVEGPRGGAAQAYQRVTRRDALRISDDSKEFAEAKRISVSGHRQGCTTQTAPAEAVIGGVVKDVAAPKDLVHDETFSAGPCGDVNAGYSGEITTKCFLGQLVFDGNSCQPKPCEDELRDINVEGFSVTIRLAGSNLGSTSPAPSGYQGTGNCSQLDENLLGQFTIGCSASVYNLDLSSCSLKSCEPPTSATAGLGSGSQARRAMYSVQKPSTRFMLTEDNQKLGLVDSFLDLVFSCLEVSEHLGPEVSCESLRCWSCKHSCASESL